MKRYLKLFRQFILRALVREKMRAVITALGISLGVAVMLAIRLANVGAIESFRRATETVAGDTSIQIAGTAGRFDELLLKDLSWLGEYGEMSPVISGYAMLESRDEFLQVLGVDILRDRSLRQYRLLQTSDTQPVPGPRELLMMLADSRSIIVTQQFARRHGLSVESRLPLLIGNTKREFIVRGLLLDEGPARALQGNFALLDIAAAQLAFNRHGLLDRVDLKLKRGLNVDQAEAEIRSKLPAQLTVTRPDSSSGSVEKMIAAFHFNLSALGSIALLVGLFLIYNTVSTSVIKRREEIGILRAIGASQRLVLALFLGEALLLASVGTGVGLVIGRLMADLAVKASATTVGTFYVATAATQAMSHRALGASEIIIAFLIALILALVAAIVPAREASRVRPIEAIRGAERISRGFKPSPRHLMISALLFLLGYLLTRFEPINGMPVLGFAGGVAVMFGGAFMVPNAIWFFCRVFEKLIGKLISYARVEARLARANLLGATSRVSISVASLAVALSMMIAISILIGSFRETVVYWLDQTLAADIYARPFTRASATDEGELAEEAIQMVRDDKEVAAVDTFSTQQVAYQGETINVAAGDFQTHLRFGRVMFKSPASGRERVLETAGSDSVMVNESFSLRFKKQVGDSIELPTTSGSRPFEVVAIYYDYSSTRGTVVMDTSAYARHFPYARISSASIFLKPGAGAEEATARLKNEVGARFPILFLSYGNLRANALGIFDSTFAITYALELIAIVVAGLGVVSTMITLILERRGELAVLSFIGATRKQIRRILVIEALLVGSVSQVVGSIIGMMLSLILIYVINVQSFGWTIQFQLPIGFFVQTTVLILVIAALAGLYPAARASRVEAVRFAREE